MGNQQPGGTSGGGAGEQQQQQQQQSHGRGGGGGGGGVPSHQGYQGYQQHQQQQYHQQIPSAQSNQVQHPSQQGGYSSTGGGGGGYPPPGGGGTHTHVPDGTISASQYIQRSSSDASMTIMDNNMLANAMESNNNNTNGMDQPQCQPQPGSGANTSNANPGIPPSVIENWLDDDTVPTVFRWEHGGRQVYITGTFNGWSRQIPMHRSGNDFSYIHNLKRGKHAFKFIVDDEWRFAPDQPTVADIEGRINNFIDVTSFTPYTGDKDFEREKAAAEYGFIPTEGSSVIIGTGGGGDDTIIDPGADSGSEPMGSSTITTSNTTTTTAAGTATASAAMNAATTAASSPSNKPDRDGEVFTTNMPDMDEYTKEPPPLPPHLRHIILNKPPQLSDTSALPVPQHVALNHLYCTAIKDNMMVLGITQRYKTKFVTTVYYSPCGK
jgi:5'-AMP-activated protein kinase, regulatory beta subunit